MTKLHPRELLLFRNIYPPTEDAMWQISPSIQSKLRHQTPAIKTKEAFCRIPCPERHHWRKLHGNFNVINVLIVIVMASGGNGDE